MIVKITSREIAKAGACAEAVESFRARFGESATEAEAFAWLKEHPYWLAWAMGGDVRWGKLLIAHGADANAEDSDGWTPMHYAEYCGHAEAVKFLIAHGADANAKNNNGMTPLHHAACRGHAEAVKILETAIAKTKGKNNNGMTP